MLTSEEIHFLKEIFNFDKGYFVFTSQTLTSMQFNKLKDIVWRLLMGVASNYDDFINYNKEESMVDMPHHVSALISFSPSIVTDLSAELNRARFKFPKAYNLNLALAEEFGELAKAQAQNLNDDEIRKEAIQVMAICVRIIEEGDKSIHIDKETIQK